MTLNSSLLRSRARGGASTARTGSRLTRRTSPLTLAWAACLSLVGCTVDESKNAAERCEISADCSAGLVCYRDFCVPGPGAPDGLSSNGAPTAGDPADASSPRTVDGSAQPGAGVDASEPDSTPSASVPTDDSSSGPVSTEPDASSTGAPIDASVALADSATPAITPPPACSRDLLRQRADAYLAAMAAGDSSPLRKHPSLRYTENGEAVQLGRGTWNSRPKVQFVRHALDEVSCGSVFFGVFSSVSGRVILGARLRYVDEQLLEVEAQVVPQNFQFFNPAGIIPDGPDPWVEPVPAATRMSREAVSRLVSNYFDSVSMRALLPPHDPACRRRQDGVLMAQQGSCGVPPGERPFSETRYSLVDETSGIATAVVVYERYVGMYLFKVSGGMLQNIDIVGGAQARSSGW